MGQLDVTFITVVNTVTALSSLQIDIRHLRILTNMLPEHLTLIMAQVDAMNMTTGILTLQFGRYVERITQSGVHWRTFLFLRTVAGRALMRFMLSPFHGTDGLLTTTGFMT